MLAKPSVSRWIGPLLLLATWLAFFSRTITGRGIYFLDDLKIIYYPLEHLYAAAQRNSELPLWSNLFGFGQPILAWAQLGFLNPVHVALRAFGLPPLVLLQVSILVYFALGLLGMYIFLRRRRLPGAAAALGGIVYTFGGFNVGHLNHVNFYTATMVLPWLLIAVEALLNRPTPRRTAAVAGLLAIVPLSGQPQISLYTLLIAALWGGASWISRLVPSPRSRSYHGRVALAAFAAGALALGLASLAWLPLREFLPSSDRSADLPTAELYEFSYPPWHAITLIMPYVFGDHRTYWGAKGFQELAAYVGIVPLLLSAVALVLPGRHRLLVIMSAGFVVGAAGMALGQYSPLYRTLVETHLLTSLTVPGRFVYFFLVGIAWLAAVGLAQLPHLAQARRMQAALVWLAAGATVALTVGPFVWYASITPRARSAVSVILTGPDATWLALGTGVAVVLAAFILNRRAAGGSAAQAALAAVAALTLIGFGWHYNPLSEPASVLSPAPFEAELRAWAAATGLPPRLYSRPSATELATQAARPLGPLSPQLTVYQPITSTAPVCLDVPLVADSADGRITVSLHTSPTAPAFEALTVRASNILSAPNEPHTICFSPEALPAKALVVGFSATEASGIWLSFTPTPGFPSAYVVRVATPTPAQMSDSRKEGRVSLAVRSPLPYDLDQALLTRHIQATAGASSARWIGALAIAPYRAFIDIFFANDSYPIDGTGRHVVDRYRALFNWSGVTHLIQSLPADAPDNFQASGLQVRGEILFNDQRVRLYANPDAAPRANLVPAGTFVPSDDEARALMHAPDFDPTQLVYVSGPVPPPATDPVAPEALGEARLTRYEDTVVQVAVTTPNPAWLVVTDSTTPQWQTYLDGQRAPYYVADTLYKAALVPPGWHTVTFRYESPATRRATYATLVSLTVLAALLAWPRVGKAIHR